MLERTDAITNEVLEPVTFVLAYHTVWRISTPIYILVLSREIPVFTLWKQVESVPMCVFILEGLLEEIFSRDVHNFEWQNQICLVKAIVILNT